MIYCIHNIIKKSRRTIHPIHRCMIKIFEKNKYKLTIYYNFKILNQLKELIIINNYKIRIMN